MSRHTRSRAAMFSAAALVTVGTLAGCQNGAGPTASTVTPAGQPSPQPSAIVKTESGAGPGDAFPTEVDLSTPAGQFADCMTKAGFKAIVIDGTVAYVADDSGGSGSAGAGQASGTEGSNTAATTDQASAEADCRKKVPAYTPPDENER